MSEKRRDNKNRVLRLGEQQRADGRYIIPTFVLILLAKIWKDMRIYAKIGAKG